MLTKPRHIATLHVSAKTDTHEHVSFDSAIQWMQRKDVVGQANVESPFQRFLYFAR